MPRKHLDYQGPRPARRRRCPVCRSDLTVIGKLAGGGFEPRKKRGWLQAEESLPVGALACCACGTVTLVVNRADLMDLAGDPAEM